MKPVTSSMQRLLFTITLFLLGSTSTNAQWQKLATLPGTASVVKFFNANFGLLGDGGSPGGPAGQTPLAIFRTIDGGFTWTSSQLPAAIMNQTGEFTDFLMPDSLNGWASVIGPDLDPANTGLLRTTDGGASWQLTSMKGNGTSVHLTSKALIVTDIGKQNQISLDSGVTWMMTVDGGKNDASFLSDLVGITSSFRGGVWELTADGGLTWQPLTQNTESWSVHAVKDSGIIYAAPEGPSSASPKPSPLIVSRDSGKTWDTVSMLPFTSTGNLSGIGDQVLFVQECFNCNLGNPVQTGFYMSSDKGITWTDIGGPPALNDTRFSLVAGCGEGFLYAFDATTNPGLYRYHFILPASNQVSKSTYHFWSARIINDSINVTIHLPIYLRHSGTMSDVEMSMHYPSTGSLKYLNGTSYDGKGIDVSRSQWVGRVALHFASSDLNAAPDSLIGFANFMWTPYEYDCDHITFDSITTSEAPCVGFALPFEGVIGSYKTCGLSSVGEDNPEAPFDFVISPNPSEKRITVSFGNNPMPLRYEFFDALGVIHRQGMTSENSLKIDISDLPSGNYYLRVSTQGGKTLTKQAVIIR